MIQEKERGFSYIKWSVYVVRNISTSLNPVSSAYNVKPASRWPYWSTKMPVSTAKPATIHAHPQPLRNMVIYQQVPIYASVLVDALLLQQQKIKWEFLYGGRGLWERVDGLWLTPHIPRSSCSIHGRHPAVCEIVFKKKYIYVYFLLYL